VLGINEQPVAAIIDKGTFLALPSLSSLLAALLYQASKWDGSSRRTPIGLCVGDSGSKRRSKPL
jgi:hypothetical protein